jgi:hypothetical protein
MKITSWLRLRRPLFGLPAEPGRLCVLERMWRLRGLLRIFHELKWKFVIA